MRVKITLASILTVVSAWALLGIFIEREWHDIHLFLKHKPSSKVLFYSPLGEADRSFVPGKEGYLDSEAEIEESEYIEFVEEGGGYRRSIRLF